MPLYALTRNVDFKWYNKCDTTFTDLKKLVPTPPVLRGPNREMPFYISIDTLDASIGIVLDQEEDRKPYVIYYTNSKKSFKQN